jgi:hypothetical protein
MTYPTIETRLVPVSDAQSTFMDSDHVIALYRDTLQRCFFCEEYRGIKEHWVDDHGLYVEPTHFLQFKINGEWTHEFKMGEE